LNVSSASKKEKPTFQIWDYVRIVLSHGWVVVLCLVVVCIGVYISARRQPTLYEARSQIEIRTGKPSKSSTSREALQTQAREFNTLLKLLNSMAVCRKVLAAMPKDLRVALFGSPTGGPQSLESLVKSKRVRSTNLVQLSARSEDRVAVARLLDLVMREFGIYAANRHQVSSNKLRKSLQLKRQAVDRKLQRAQKLRDQFKRKHPEVSGFKAFQQTFFKLAGQLLSSINLAEIQIFRLKPGVKFAEAARTFLQKEQLAVVQANKQIVRNRTEAGGLRRQLVELIKRLGPGHNEVIAVRGEIKANEREYRTLVQVIWKSLLRSYQFQVEARGSMQKSLQEQREDMKLRGQDYHEFEKLLEDVNQLVEQHQSIQLQIDRTYTEAPDSRDMVIVIDGAEIPSVPVSKQPGTTYMIAVIFGLIGGIGMALLLEFLDDTVKTEDDILGRLDLDMLGFVPYIRGDAENAEIRHLVTHHQPKSAVSESFRSIRTKVVFSLKKLLDGQDRGAVIVVTSSQPREGKTTISSNLAITMAHSGTRVLLLDADLRKPRVHTSFKLNGNLGLTNYLAGEAHPHDIIQDTGVNNLWAITSGPLPPNPYELLGSPKMRQLLTELREEYDILIFDTPPLIFVPDASVLAGAVDGVIHVISAYITRRKLVAMGKERVDSIGGTLLGAVLNNVDPSKTDYYYYYYYYPGYYRYYNRYYGPEDEKAAPRQLAEPDATPSER